MVGQHARTTCGSMNENEALDGLVDELRVWSVVRTASELQQYMYTALPLTPTPPPSLSFYFRFDGGSAPLTATRPALEPDLSGHHNHGRIGAVATYQGVITWNSARAATVPTRPAYLSSARPLLGSGLVIAHCAPGQSVSIVLTAFDSDVNDTLSTTIVSLPQAGGVLAQTDNTPITAVPTALTDPTPSASKSVRYTAHPLLFNATGGGDRFRFEVSDGTTTVQAAVHVLLSTLPATPDLRLELNADSLQTLILGGVTHGGVTLNVIITSLPAKGQLYHASFVPQPVGVNSLGPALQYSAMVMDPTMLTNVTTAPTAVTNARGVVMYQPTLYESGVNYTSFRYRWTDGTQQSSEVGPQISFCHMLSLQL